MSFYSNLLIKWKKYVGTYSEYKNETNKQQEEKTFLFLNKICPENAALRMSLTWQCTSEP